MHILGGGLACLLFLASCDAPDTGPIRISAIGKPPKLDNPNLKPLDAASALLVEATAEGLVRFDASGQIEPGLAQSWIVSDDGLRYTFRLSRLQWPNGNPITAQQVVARLKAAGSRSSRNSVKALLGAINEIMAMTDEVLEIELKSPRPNFLQLLAQPEMGIIVSGQGAGPYRPTWQEDGTILLERRTEAESQEQEEVPQIMLRGEAAPMAVARFLAGDTDLIAGGTAGDLPIARAARPGINRFSFDPVAGLFGLIFVHKEGPFANAALRRALNMSVDRPAIIASIAAPGLEPRDSLIAPGIDELPQPALPAWAAEPLPMRREVAVRTIASLSGTAPLTVRVAMPNGPGYRLVFAHLRRDWAAIGVDARRVGMQEKADLRFIDAVAPARLASWYLRHFTCQASPVCDPAADEMMEAARTAQDLASRRDFLANADRLLAEAVPFIPIAAPIRWSLLSPRLTAFRPNIFSRHYVGELVSPAP